MVTIREILFCETVLVQRQQTTKNAFKKLRKQLAEGLAENCLDKFCESGPSHSRIYIRASWLQLVSILSFTWTVLFRGFQFMEPALVKRVNVF